jgi:hypothetical protein
MMGLPVPFPFCPRKRGESSMDRGIGVETRRRGEASAWRGIGGENENENESLV